MNLKKIALVASISCAFTLAAAQGPAPKKAGTAKPPAAEQKQPDNAASAKPPAALPTEVEIDASMKRSFGYDPSLSWQILEIHASPVPGIAEVLVSVNKQPPLHIYLAPGVQSAFVGELIPFGPNPYAPARAKLQAADGPSRGGQNAPIQIVEFSDLQCPHCKAAQPVVEKLAADFPQVRFVFQQFPLPASLHPWAMKAAQYADCAGHMNKDAFWKYINSIFENQGGIALATADDKLKELATAAGLDAQKIVACSTSPETDARIKKSLDLGQALNITSTPTVFINGRMVPGIASIPYDQLKNLVQFEIDHARK